jgi:3-oxoacyl-[acyl-carrier-protein] synthase-1
MRRVVVSGLGIVSCLGCDAATVTESLRHGRSGIKFIPEFAEQGLRSQVGGRPEIDLESRIDRKVRRFMGDAAAYAYVAMVDAIADAALTRSEISNPRTGLVAGSGGGSMANQIAAVDKARSAGVRRIGPYMVPRTMCSTVSACLATPFGIRGLNYSIASACATAAHCIGHAAEQIRWGRQDIVFAGGGDELNWGLAALFDAMGALSAGRNDAPESASRSYDVGRDGFVIAGGGGMLVLEALEHAEARGARILAELVGYGATSDGHDMVAPSGEGAVRCMQMALEGLTEPVDYLNTHGTSTPLGDLVELRAIRDVFGANIPQFSSTKSLSGHSLGAAGVHAAIYCLLMMQNDFMAASANIDELDAEAADFPVLRELHTSGPMVAMSNSFGFGGTNASLVFRRWPA